MCEGKKTQTQERGAQKNTRTSLVVGDVCNPLTLILLENVFDELQIFKV